MCLRSTGSRTSGWSRSSRVAGGVAVSCFFVTLAPMRVLPITFTRGRPNHSNDQAHIEQKNWTRVRRTVGYLSSHSCQVLSGIELFNSDPGRVNDLSFNSPTSPIR